MATVTQEVLLELECPVCMEVFRPPVIICTNGHSTCKKCKMQVNCCPICRATFLNVRNRTVEKVVSKLSGQCRYHGLGCNVTFPMDDIIEHEMICPLRPYRCPMAGCMWNRPLAVMIGHLTAKHGTSVRAATEKSVSTLKNFGITFNWRCVILFNNKIFVHMSEVRANMLYTCVLHVGPENKTHGLRYHVEIRREDGSEYASADHTVWNYTNGLDRIITSGNCASFNYHFAKKCALQGSRLDMQVQITDSQT